MPSYLLVVTYGFGVLLPASSGYRLGMLLKSYNTQQQPSTAKNDLVQKVDSAEVEACALDSPCVPIGCFLSRRAGVNGSFQIHGA